MESLLSTSDLHVEPVSEVPLAVFIPFMRFSLEATSLMRLRFFRNLGFNNLRSNNRMQNFRFLARSFFACDPIQTLAVGKTKLQVNRGLIHYPPQVSQYRSGLFDPDEVVQVEVCPSSFFKSDVLNLSLNIPPLSFSSSRRTTSDPSGHNLARSSTPNIFQHPHNVADEPRETP